jgi:hypothetical protein
MKKLAVIGSVLVTAIALAYGLLAGIKWYAWAPAREMERTARAMIGHPETDIVKAFGEPQHVVSSDTLAGRTVDYPWKDMHYVPVPDRAVRNKVLLYSRLTMALYIYVDDHGLVEYVATAWT